MFVKHRSIVVVYMTLKQEAFEFDTYLRLVVSLGKTL